MNKETQVLDTLASAGGPLCDDCITTSVGWNERQQAHAVASRLADGDVIVRAVGICSRCGRRRVASGLPPAAVEHEGSQTTDSPHEQRARIVKLLQDGQLEGEAIAAEVGVPRDVVSAVEAEVALDAYTARQRDREADALAATLEVTCGLERDLQVALRADIQQLETGLRIVDDGHAQGAGAGRIDITAQDADGIAVVIELKAGKAAPAALTQLLAHMDAVAGADRSPVRGILVAGDFHPDAVAAARATAHVQLRRYRCSFTVEAAE